MATRTSVRTLAALALLASAATAAANPVIRGRGGNAVPDEDVVLIAGIAAAVVEWAILLWAFRRVLRNAWNLAGVVLLAHLFSYPLTLAAAFRIARSIGIGYAAAAEWIAVLVEAGVYLVAFRVLPRLSPLCARPSVLRILAVTVVANAVTWLLGIGYVTLRGTPV